MLGLPLQKSADENVDETLPHALALLASNLAQHLLLLPSPLSSQSRLQRNPGLLAPRGRSRLSSGRLPWISFSGEPDARCAKAGDGIGGAGPSGERKESGRSGGPVKGVGLGCKPQ